MGQELSTTDVKDRNSFIEFISSLRRELEANPTDWENNTLNSFLRALENYTIDIQGYYDNMHLGIDADIPSWRVFADILTGASIYE